MHFLSNRLTGIRNGKSAQLSQISFVRPERSIPKNIFAILTILRNLGIIRSFMVMETRSHGKYNTQITINLKYDSTGKSVIDSIFLVSKPSRRVYISSSALWQPQTTTGFLVLSTSYGIITDSQARRQNLGGEVLFGIT